MLPKNAITITSLVIILFAPMIVYSFMREDSGADEPKTRSVEGAQEDRGSVANEQKKSHAPERVVYDLIPSSALKPEAYTILNPPLTGVNTEEKELMQRLRQVQESDPVEALELARKGNRLYPKSRFAAERAGRVVKSLALLGKLAQARGEAEKMVNTYAGTPWALEVERHTGAHPRLDR